MEATNRIFSPSRLLLRTAIISAPLGALIGFIFGGMRLDSSTPRALLQGALIAVAAALLATSSEIVLHQRLERLPPSTARAIRIALFTAAGLLGYIIGGGVGRVLIWNRPFFPSGDRALTYSMIVSSIIAALLGFTFYSYERLKDRLLQSAEQLKEQEFAAKELEIARAIQQRLLPPEQLEGDGYRIAARNLAARFVAGDFYDVFHLSDGSVGVVVADVAGKGVGASLIMASAKAIVPLIAEGRGVAEAMNALNEKLSLDLSRREFVALAYARLDPRSGVVEIANAGVPDPYLIRKGGSPESVHVPGTRLPLGAMRAASYESVRLQLAPGDRLMLFTDGFPEAIDLNGEQLGYERLAAMLPSDKADIRQWLDGLMTRLREATAPGLDDDCTALVMERC